MDKTTLAVEAIQFVTLGIGGELFGIEVGVVQEILDFRPITPLPHTPAYLLGMIDVRGATVAVLDLRAKLGLPRTDVDEHTRILVLELNLPRGRGLLGLVADRVCEVAELDGGLMEAPPEIGIHWRSDYIRGVGRRGEAFVVIFNLDQLISSEESALIPIAQDAA